MRELEQSGHTVAETTEAPEQYPIDKDDQDMPSPKSTRSPAFQFYPKDFLSSSKVGRMSLTERGAYITLLAHCWLDGSLKEDPAILARIVGMKEKQFTRMWCNGPLHECFDAKNGRLTNDRLERERKVQADYRKRQVENGHKGGRPRKGLGSFGLSKTEPTKSSPSASAISDLQSASAGGGFRTAPLVARRRMDAAFEGPRVYVPQRVHTDFLGFRNGNADELHKWYEAVSEEWATGAKRTAETGPDMIAFWKARYAEKWPAAAPAQSHAQRRPSWAPKAVQS